MISPRPAAAALLLAVLVLPGWPAEAAATTGRATAPAATGRAAAPSVPAAARKPAGAPPGTDAAPPRLIVILVIDMFPAEFLTRFRDRSAAGGFARLIGGGALFTDCAYRHAITDTAPGHASIATGTTPDRHGIVGNQWYDRALGRMVGAVEDPDTPLVGAAGTLPGASPRHLMGDTLGDEMRLASGGRGRTIGISEKDRAAVLLAGRAATGAYFYEQATGRMITSRHYVQALPGWAAAFNDARPADRYYGRGFAAGGATLVPPGKPGTQPGREFYTALPGTPWIDELLLDFARAAIAGGSLGADGDTDLLAISLSGHDYVGHDQGPHSPAVAEMTARVDAGIAAFLRDLDERIGRGRYWVALTADHGTAPTLETSRRIGLGEPGFEGPVLRREMGRALAARYGDADPLRLLGETTKVWFDAGELARHRATTAEAARVAGQAAVGAGGIAGWVAAGGSSMDAATVEAYRLATYPGRSPDLYLVRAPFALDSTSVAADHGTPWSYDAHVPLILYGAPFRSGTYRLRASPADIAPTLANALGMTPPAMATGRVLAEAFR